MAGYHNFRPWPCGPDSIAGLVRNSRSRGAPQGLRYLPPIDPAFWELVDGRLVLQHDRKAWNLWHEDLPGNLVKADANWPGLVERNVKGR